VPSTISWRRLLAAVATDWSVADVRYDAEEVHYRVALAK